MTDQELIQLLQEKPASEFTADELEALRNRWTQSAELRQALINHLHLESQLSGALANVELDINAIILRAAEQGKRKSATSRRSWKWVLGLGFLLLIGLAGIVKFTAPKQLEDPIAQSDLPPVDRTNEPSVSPIEGNQPSEMDTKPDTSAETAVATAANADKAESTEPAAIVVLPTKPAEVAAIEEPWTKSLGRDVAPWPANSPKLTRDLRAAGHDELSEVEAKRWFSQVEGEPFNWGQDVYGNNQRRAARFHGFARLRAPWPDSALLRLTPFDVTDLTLYLWRGPTGIALRLYTRRDPHTWAAYEITRENSSPKPLRWGLLTTDNGAYVRAGTGIFDLRYQDGGITLAKGGIPLMTAPLAGCPTEVFFEGQFRLRGISIHKSAPMASVPETTHPIVLAGSGSELPWTASAETPAEIESHANGSATFRVDSRDKVGTMILPLNRRGLYETIFRVDSADPGTGLFLGDLDGRPLHRVGFFKDSATGRTTIGILRPGENRDQSNTDFNSSPSPYQTPTQWVKIVGGLGTGQILVSGDGHHWGHLTDNPLRDLPGAVASVGLFGIPGPAPRVLKIARIEVRELSGLTGLCDRKLEAVSPQFTLEELKDFTRWTHRVVDSVPATVDPANWFMACAISAFSQSPSREFAVDLLKRTMAIAVRSEIGLEQKLNALDDVALLIDSWEESSVKPFAELYESLGEQLAEADHPHPLSVIRPAVLRSLFWTHNKLRFAWERLNSRELLRTIYRNDWAGAWDLAQSTIYWNSDAHPNRNPVERAEFLTKQARWVRAIAVENSAQLDDGQSGVLPGAWRHPLALQWNKEAYNVRAELQSALAGQTFEDACRIVTSISVNDGPGLLPDVEDRQLFVSLPTAVAGAMQAYPPFAKLMAEKFGPMGGIRVRQAIRSGDVRGVQSATLQFYGTEAAAEAHQWLGDREMAAGGFPSAEEHFQLAIAHAPSRQREALQSRLQLAMSLNGKPRSSALTTSGSIDLNGRMISSTEMESLVSSISARPSPMKRFQRDPVSVAPPLLPASFKGEVRAAFDGQPGLNPGRHEYRFGDPFGRQLAVAIDQQRIYINNRFQVNAYALPSGGQQWSVGLGSEQGEAHAMPFTPMNPLIAGDRLFVRRITKGGVELACVNADNGQIVWTQRPNLHVLSDPVFWNGSLFGLTLARIDEDMVQVEATRFDFVTGAPTSSQPLFRLRDVADRSYAAQLTISGRLAICSLNGVTACFNRSGEIQWLRRHIWLPKEIDELHEDFRVAAPYLQGNRVVVSVPGVRTVTCMDIETGRLAWERTIPELKGIVAGAENRLLVECSTGVIALAINDGSVAWSVPMNARLEACHVGDHHVVLARRVTTDSNTSRPFLKWVDLESGSELAQSQIIGVDRNECQLGPMFFASGKWWGMLGQGSKETKRDLLEFTVATPLVPGPFPRAAWTSWSPSLRETQLADLALVMPGWRPETNYGLQFVPTDVRGELQTVTIKAEPAQEYRLLQVVDVPVGRKVSLHLRYGVPADRKWNLSVRANKQPLFEQTVEEAGSNNGWRDTVIDLSPFAGRTIPIQIVHTIPANNPATDVFWKRAGIVVE